MAVYRACYCSRNDVMSATDISQTQSFIRHVDSALEAGAEEADRLCKRKFYNQIQTVKRDWPNFQRAYPWRIWMDAKELSDSDGTGPLALAPVVTTGGTLIPAGAILWGPWSEDAPPYRWLELDRSQSYSFGVGSTPQQDVHITGVFGYWGRTRAAGTLTTAMSDTTSTTALVSNSYLAEVGDVLIAGTEQLLVQDAAYTDTGVAASSGGTTALDNDNVLTVPSGLAFAAGEVIQIDAEQMLIESVTGNSLTVQRSYLGTVLAAHVTPEIYAQRSLTVQRGFGGTTKTTHTQGSALLASLVPGMVREYAIAEALNYVFQKTSGYARTIGEGGPATPVPGGSLPGLRDRVREAYGRKARTRVV